VAFYGVPWVTGATYSRVLMLEETAKRNLRQLIGVPGPGGTTPGKGQKDLSILQAIHISGVMRHPTKS